MLRGRSDGAGRQAWASKSPYDVGSTQNAQIWDEYHIHYGANIGAALGLPSTGGCEFGVCHDDIPVFDVAPNTGGRTSSSVDLVWWKAFVTNAFSWQVWKEGSIEGWRKGYYKCLAKRMAGGATAPVVTHAAGMAATKAVEENAKSIAGAYY